MPRPYLALGALWLTLGCGSEDTSNTQGRQNQAGSGQVQPGACQPFSQFPCVCAGNIPSQATCSQDGTYALCNCAPGTAGAGGGFPVGGAAGLPQGGAPQGGFGGNPFPQGGSAGIPQGGSAGIPQGGSAGIPQGGTGGDAAGGAGGVGPGGAGGVAGSSGAGGMGGGTCCSSGDCICRNPPPSSLSADKGPYATMSYDLTGVGCVHYPTDAQAPFSAVAISDGFLGTGGCGLGAQTSGWGPLLASHGIVTMIINTLGGDQPAQRGTKLLAGIAAFKTENTKSGSPLFGKLAGRYGTSGFSMGGGGTTRATVQDHTLLSSVAIMPYSPDGAGVVTPTLVICGSSDTIAPCASHGTPVYGEIPATTPKMRVTVNSSHSGQPSAGGNMSGAWGLAFHKTFLDGDERWRPLLVGGNPTATNIQ